MSLDGTGPGTSVIERTTAADNERTDILDDRNQVVRLQEQTAAVAREYPELFAYLNARDRLIHRTTMWIPLRGDPEGYVSPQRLEALLDALLVLPPGIAAFVLE